MKGLDVRLEPGGLAGVEPRDRPLEAQADPRQLPLQRPALHRAGPHPALRRATRRARSGSPSRTPASGSTPATRRGSSTSSPSSSNPDAIDGEGTGLGLAICRRLAEPARRRDPRSTSAPGRGSTFTLVLPASVLTLDRPGPTPDDALDAARDRRRGDPDRRGPRRQPPDPGPGPPPDGLPRPRGRATAATPSTWSAQRAPARRPDGREHARHGRRRGHPGPPRRPATPRPADLRPDRRRHRRQPAPDRRGGVNGYLEKPVTWDALQQALDSARPPPARSRLTRRRSAVRRPPRPSRDQAAAEPTTASRQGGAGGPARTIVAQDPPAVAEGPELARRAGDPRVVRHRDLDHPHRRATASLASSVSISNPRERRRDRPRGSAGRRRGSPRAGRRSPGPIRRRNAARIRTLPSPRTGDIAPASATGRRAPTVMSAAPVEDRREQRPRRLGRVGAVAVDEDDGVAVGQLAKIARTACPLPCSGTSTTRDAQARARSRRCRRSSCCRRRRSPPPAAPPATAATTAAIAAASL